MQLWQGAIASLSVCRRHNSRRGDKPLRLCNVTSFAQSFSCITVQLFDLSYDSAGALWFYKSFQPAIKVIIKSYDALVPLPELGVHV